MGRRSPGILPSLWVAAVATACGSAEHPGRQVADVEILPLSSGQTPSKTSAALRAPEGSPAVELEDCIADVRTEPFPGGAISDDASSYNTAMRRELAGELDAARKGYLELIQGFPKSPYVPLSYLAFGELFRDEARTDPAKVALAQQAYREVLKFPVTQNPVFGVALLRSAETQATDVPDQTSLAALSRVLSEPALGSCAPALRAAAAVEVVPAYLKVGQPAKAAAFFARIAPGAPDFGASATVRLARLLVDAGRAPEAKLAIEGLAGQPGPLSDAYCGDAAGLAGQLAATSAAAQIHTKCSPPK